MITSEQFSQIETNIEKKAEETAYRLTEHYSDHKVQSAMYELCKSHIILGARMFEEELLKIEENET